MNYPPGSRSQPRKGAPVPRLDGPWTHREVAANGARFHIAEAGDGPLVLLLHGFPQFWWTWRHQLTALADAGFRAVAMDLRGVGGSDRTPARLRPGQPRAGRDRGDPLARRAGRRARRPRPGRLSGVDGGGDAAQAGAAPRGLLDAAPAALAHRHAHRPAAEPVRNVCLELPAAVAAGASTRRERRRTGRAADPRVVRARACPTRSRWTSTGGPCRSRRRRTARSSRTAGWCGRWPGPDGIQFNRRMKRPVRVPTLHLHGSLDPAIAHPQRGRAAGSTSRRPTAGGSSTGWGTSRTRRTRRRSPPS